MIYKYGLGMGYSCNLFDRFLEVELEQIGGQIFFRGVGSFLEGKPAGSLRDRCLENQY
jgi:hypothetical protein